MQMVENNIQKEVKKPKGMKNENQVEKKRYFGREITNFVKENIPENIAANKNLVPSKNFLYKYTRNLSLDSSLFSSQSKSQKDKEVETPKFLTPVQYFHVDPELEYIDDIYNSLLEEEDMNDFYRIKDYMQIQFDFSPKLRALLVNFMFEVSIKFQLKIKTLYLSVLILDRFLSHEFVTKTDFQLIGITCLLIGAKNEEIYYPELYDWIMLSNSGNISIHQIVQTEILILEKINYNLLPVYPYSFYEILANKMQFKRRDFLLGCMILEVVTYEYALIKYKSSIIAESVVGLILKISSKNNGTYLYDKVKFFQSFPNFDKSQGHLRDIAECTKIICGLMDNIACGIFKVVREKYSKKEYDNVADFSTFLQ